MKPGTDFVGVGVGAMVRNEKGEILFLKRTEQCGNEPGKWTFPGGKLEFGETQEQAVKREVLEEAGLEVEIVRLLKIVDHILKEEKQHWFNPVYEVRIVGGKLENMEPHKCAEMAWFAPKALPAEMTANLAKLFADIQIGKIEI